MSSSCLPHIPGPRTLATHERVSIFAVGPVSRRHTTGTAPMSLRRTRELTFINPCTRMGSRCVFSALVECRKYYIEPPPQMCDESVHSPDLPAAERRHGAVVVAGRRSDGVGRLLSSFASGMHQRSVAYFGVRTPIPASGCRYAHLRLPVHGHNAVVLSSGSGRSAGGIRLLRCAHSHSHTYARAHTPPQNAKVPESVEKAALPRRSGSGRLPGRLRNQL